MALVALPMLIVYALAPRLVLRLAFGEETVQAAGALLVLGVAMTLLAGGYLCVQYMLALRRVTFLYALAAAAAAEVVAAGRRGPEQHRGLRRRGARAAGGAPPSPCSRSAFPAPRRAWRCGRA